MESFAYGEFPQSDVGFPKGDSPEEFLDNMMTFLREAAAKLENPAPPPVLAGCDAGPRCHPGSRPCRTGSQQSLAGDVNVCLGQDDISDAYYPFGRNNMPEVAFLASHLLWMTREKEIATLYEMITTRAAEAMNLGNYGLKAGCAANLVVLDQPSVSEALRLHTQPAAVISHGRLVDAEKDA